MHAFVRHIFFTVALTVAIVRSASAAVIAIDLDAATAGIQGTLTVSQGANLSAQVVYIGDGASLFDSVAFDVAFNQSGGGSVVSLASGPAAGLLADQSLFALDIVAGTPTAQGASLGTGNNGAPGGFSDNLGGVGLTSLGSPFSAVPFPTTAFGNGVATSIVTLNIVASAPGQTLLDVFGFPGGSPFLALAGSAVGADILGARLTVEASPVPLPSMLVPFAFVTVGAIRMRRRTAKASAVDETDRKRGG
jgi:hypothetical protein